jgi:ParB family chromosome partitioning protein
MTVLVREIPLSQLVESKSNVRRSARTEGIAELAASIEAHGLLQNLTVRPVGSGKKKSGKFEVIAGGRRLAALKSLAKRKALAADASIPCCVRDDGIAEEISLAENVGQCPMHPADQFEAFAKLHAEHGMSAEDIAARFGVTATVVKQRLKLGAVSPKLIEEYREGALNLDQLTAFAITDDHQKQERVWAELPPHNRHRWTILRALGEGQVQSDDRRAVFVGAKAYEAAGGVIVRDLFDANGSGFFTDAELLNRLVREKLQPLADDVAKEGWKWVTVEPEYDYAMSADMRRVYPEATALTPDEQRQLDELSKRHDALMDEHGEDMPEDAAEEFERIEAAIEALKTYEFRPSDITIAGAIVTVGHGGEVRIERGLVRAEDEPARESGAGDNPPEKAKSDGPAPLSERLVADLTAHRTAALRDRLAQTPNVALIAVVHRLAATTFFSGYKEASCLELSVRSAFLPGHAPGIEESLACRQIAERHEGWAKRMPSDVEGLWGFVENLSGDDRLSLLAHCLAFTVNAVDARGQHGKQAGAHAGVLARAVGLDMAAYWQPTPASYLGRVPKERILEAVREGVSDDAARGIRTMKKQGMAEAAARLLAGKGWLPAQLRTGASETSAG